MWVAVAMVAAWRAEAAKVVAQEVVRAVARVEEKAAAKVEEKVVVMVAGRVVAMVEEKVAWMAVVVTVVVAMEHQRPSHAPAALRHCSLSPQVWRPARIRM